jgi:hypothetical protein
MSESKQVSTGLESFDTIVDYLWYGDNVVWHTPSFAEYKRFAKPYVEHAIRQGHKVHYIRFAEYDPIVDESIDGVIIHSLNPGVGFENFTRQVHEIIKKAGKRAYFVFECL